MINQINTRTYLNTTQPSLKVVMMNETKLSLKVVMMNEMLDETLINDVTLKLLQQLPPALHLLHHLLTDTLPQKSLSVEQVPGTMIAATLHLD